MKKFITATLSLLLLTALFAPAVISLTSIDLGVAVAQETSTTGATSAQGNAFLGEKELTRALQGIGGFFLQIGATFLWLAGALFNFGIKYSILDFANFSNIAGITIAWTVFRDIANVFFIFIFLAIGISTILGLQQYNVKKLLPILLGVAILINFSLFFTKVTIDIAHGFAGAILNQSGVVTTECNGENDCRISQGVATAFIEQLGVIDIFGKSVETSLGPPVGEGQDTRIFNGDRLSDGFGALLFGFFGFIFLSAAAIVFLAGAVMLIMRIVTLLLLMVAAAPAFAAYILPSTKKHFDTWLNTLIKEALFAPILLLLFAVSLLFLNTARVALPGLSSGEASFADVFINGNLGSVDVIIVFLISLGLLFTSIKVANDMGVSGAKMAMSIQKTGQGIAGRTFIGLPAQGLDKTNRFAQRQARKAGTYVSGKISGAISPYLEKDQTSGVAAKMARQAGRTVTGTVGNIVGGAGTLVRRTADSAVDSAAQAGRSEKFGSGHSIDSLQEAQEKRDDTLDAETTQIGKERRLSAAVASGKDDAIQEAIADMSDKQLLELKGTRLASEEIVRNLTPSQLKKVLESDKFDDKTKESIRETRFKELTEAIGSKDPGIIKDAIRSYDDDELDFAPKNMLRDANVASAMKGSQATHIKKSKNFTASQKAEFKTARTARLISIIGTPAGTPHEIAKLIKNLDVDEIIDLDPKYLSDWNVASNLSIPALTKLQNERSVPDKDREEIAKALDARTKMGEKGLRKYLDGPAGSFWQE